MSEEQNGKTSMKIELVKQSGDPPQSSDSQNSDNLSSLAAFSTEFLARSSQDSGSSPMEEQSIKSESEQTVSRIDPPVVPSARPIRLPHPLSSFPFRPGFPMFGLNYQNAMMLNSLIAQQQWGCFGPRLGSPLLPTAPRVEGWFRKFYDGQVRRRVFMASQHQLFTQVSFVLP